MSKNCAFKKLICIIGYYAIIVFFVVIAITASCCCVKMFYPELNIGNYADLLTAIIAIFALIITLSEYLSAKDAKQAQVFSEYNKRYSEDANIIKVVKYLNFHDKGGKINNPVPVKPSNYEVEMFMRFFEELELQIQYNRLCEKDVIDLFIYYADLLYNDVELRSDLGVTDLENWDTFIALMQRKKD